MIEGIGKSRTYDLVVDGVRHELKRWRTWETWSDDVLRKQFINDLANPKIEKLEDLKWVFKKSEGITEETLRNNIVKSLENEASKEALKQIPLEKIISFTKKKNLNETSKIQALIDHLKIVDNFDTVFKLLNNELLLTNENKEHKKLL